MSLLWTTLPASLPFRRLVSEDIESGIDFFCATETKSKLSYTMTVDPDPSFTQTQAMLSARIYRESFLLGFHA